MSINIRNAFGNAEIVSGKSSYGVDSVNELTDKDTLTADKQSSLQLNFRKPLNANPDDNLDFGIYKLHQSHLSIMSYQDTLQGISLARCFAHEYGYYKFGYQGVWRENHGLSPNAALRFIILITAFDGMLVIL